MVKCQLVIFGVGVACFGRILLDSFGDTVIAVMKPQGTIHQALKNGNLDKSCINHFVKTYQPTPGVQLS